MKLKTDQFVHDILNSRIVNELNDLEKGGDAFLVSMNSCENLKSRIGLAYSYSFQNSDISKLKYLLVEEIRSNTQFLGIFQIDIPDTNKQIEIDFFANTASFPKSYVISVGNPLLLIFGNMCKLSCVASEGIFEKIKKSLIREILEFNVSIIMSIFENLFIPKKYLSESLVRELSPNVLRIFMCRSTQAVSKPDITAALFKSKRKYYEKDGKIHISPRIKTIEFLKVFIKNL
ncbi:hypothetical protein EHQ46_15740 [Leptospira yanagawae]|uniref:Uncharacterized protein n=1 Tax=Leptospira yanagawae TaxID=293069 RepID=A0ABY2LXY2_9LEPT|nr:hypothetical protein [Leptospira yanagawae]TGL17907.1 hypothetical protein EHQ46_15740 [Leptospira yanagawae]